MTSPRVTVPPPAASDHEDVAWALRAASAQWRRDAHTDAIAWVERAAETAEEVGSVGRSVELLQLAEALRRGSLAAVPPPPVVATAPPVAAAPAVAAAPPPPLGARASSPRPSAPLPPLPSTPPSYGRPPQLSSAGPVIEVDFEEEEVEFLDDDDEIVSLDDDEEITGAVAPPSALGSAPSVDLSEVPSEDADFGASFEGSLDQGADDDIEFGEVEFGTRAGGDEPRTATPSVRFIEPPSAPDFGEDDLDLSSPAEIAMSQRAPARVDHEDLERELGVDLSLRFGGEDHLPRTRTGPKRPEVEEEREPVGFASVRPSRPPGPPDRVVSAFSEPFLEAPSAAAPEVAPRPPIEPPSRPSEAPPAALMREPDAEFDSFFATVSSSAQSGAAAPAGAGRSATGSSPHHAPPSSRRSSLPPRNGGSWLDGVDALTVAGLMDIPEETLAPFLGSATIHRLDRGEEVNAFGVALVTSGAVQLMPTIADAACALARKGEVIFTRGTIEGGVELRVVGYDPGTRVATMTAAAFDGVAAACPWVVDELAEVADRYQALAGAVLGPLGDSLDEMFRGMVLDRCVVKRPRPLELIAKRGKPTNGFYVVGTGHLEVLDEAGNPVGELASGDFLFPETILSAAPASNDVRVGPRGALLLYIDRMGAHELLATCPPFIELLAGA